MNAQGVIAESIISFKITWTNPGKGKQPKFDQTKQVIEIHETDVYPDLIYTSAYGAPQYVKYTSGAMLNELIMAIDAVIDAKLGTTDEAVAALPPGPIRKGLPAGPNTKSLPAGPNTKGLPPGPEAAKALAAGKSQLGLPAGDSQNALPPGPDQPKQLGQGGRYDLVKVDEPGLPAVIDTIPAEEDPAEVTPDEVETAEAGEDSYTVTVYGDKLRFIEGQMERGAYAGGIKFLYKVSNNLIKTVSGDQIDNTSKIWAEVKMSGLLGKTIKFEFGDFNETEFKFGGNLLVQVLPSVELSFTPDQNSVYAKEKPELDLADVIKATSITLGNKSNDEIKAIQKMVQKELDVREPKPKQNDADKQSETTDNK